MVLTHKFYIVVWCLEQQWGWNSINVLDYLISVRMTYPVINHSVCFVVSFRSNVLNITRLNYIVQWKYEYKHVISITTDHFTGKITLNNSESPFYQTAYFLHLLLLSLLLEWNKMCMCTESLSVVHWCVKSISQHFLNLLAFLSKGFWSLCW